MSQAIARSERESAPNVIVLGPGQGRAISGPEGLTLKASGEETGGALGFLEATTPPGFGPPRHIHYGCDELFYVLEGEFDFLLGDRIVHAGPGTFVFIPRGTVHAPKVVGSAAGRVLTAMIPGGVEQPSTRWRRSFSRRAGHRTWISFRPSPESTTPSSWGRLCRSGRGHRVA